MEFNALIFCGQGTSLDPLTTQYGLPKAILPVANKPLIHYVLDWCDQAPFKSISVISDIKSGQSISECVESYQSSRNKELSVTSPIKILTNDATSTGGAITSYFEDTDALENYLILPCDFITDLPPQVLIEYYRQNSDEYSGLTVFYNNIFENIDSKHFKSNYTLYSKESNGTNVLLDMYSKEFVNMDKFLKIRTQLLWRYPRTSVSTKLLDSFIFFVSSKLKQESKNIQMNRSITKIKRDLARRSWKHSTTKESLAMFALPEKSMFVRCNNLLVYMEANRYILKNLARSQGKPTISKEKNAATVGNDSLVGENSILGERTSVKKSVIGNNCIIGKKCRISNCVLLDGIVLEDEVQLENCIIGKNVKMEMKCKLVNCNVEGSYIVGTNVNLKGETLKNISLDEMSGSEDAVYESTDEELSGSEDEEYDDVDFSEEEYEDDIFAR
ncbi:translation initiation factor eIF2B subunit gamma [Martiniozyma asiatica (nom. inval.)]|nr:translation initiation factor eIF2B subunit gamma [Martiniozyma asiatica]